MHTEKEKLKGILAAIGAYLIWGVLPLYWKMADDVPASEILAYRIIWSFVFMVVIIAILGKTKEVWTEIFSIFKRPKLILAISVAAVLITANWFIFIFTVNDGHVISASLGYYINPLINVLLATIFLKEKLSRGEMLAVLSAAIGVLILAIHQGVFPWAAISMAVTFGLYGLIKKLVPISAWGGLTIETLIMAPFAFIFLLFFAQDAFMHFGFDTNLVLFGAGVVTAIPLLLFATSARRISYVMLGFIQYVGPTLMLILGVFVFHEAFDKTQLIAFLFIWAALLIFTISNVIITSKLKKASLS
ncbi:EamA family transporter RarD [Paenilisteria rocourtiae]|uniref:Chloramphenicol-sensitive protein RarD n=1 Tax=Listeria rocourtiae TaxID=647910 RepID=A0A4R6ZSR3_9LIST|nr:EamA family transporter RarD [Listeria rocourtiae]EUJ48070.1 RarD protein [Listeria rocourtiae FSL F6-920]MBC1603225.1 EamA family transporter RarD [Listeria rocourtiae]TDR55492.1 chloramphenicol-sensitive protein RarD [Listeria rocourtiae]